MKRQIVIVSFALAVILTAPWITAGTQTTRPSSASERELESLALSDRAALSERIREEGMLAETHPSHRAALDVAFHMWIRADPDQVDCCLQFIRPTGDFRAGERCGRLLTLLARADPARGRDACDRLDRQIADANTLSVDDARWWRYRALQGRLEAAGVNFYVPRYTDRLFAKIERPPVVDHISRVCAIVLDTQSSDIGRYFAERASPAALAEDVASLEMIGAERTAAVLARIHATVGVGATAAEWRDRVAAVRQLGPPTVKKLTAELLKPPDDLAELMLLHQLANANVLRKFIDECDQLSPAIDPRSGYGQPTTDVMLLPFLLSKH